MAGSAIGEHNMKVPEWTWSLRVAEGARKNRKLGRNPRTMRLTGEPTRRASRCRFFDRADPLERVARKTYRTRDQARADVFDYIERFYNPRRRHSTIGYISPMEFEAKVRLA